MLGLRLFFIKKMLRRVKDNADYKNIPRARKGFERYVARFNQPLKGFTYAPFEAAGITGEWITPDGANDKQVLLYFHGGGYATGSHLTHRSLVSQIVKSSGTKALVINYSLAPEHKYPAPIEDAAKVYEWLLQNQYDPSQIAFGGDSAGGGVTFGTLLYLRDQNIPLPKCAIGLSPWLDMTQSGHSHTNRRQIEPMLTVEALPLWIENYIGDADPKSPYCSPIFHSLSGLPPVYIQVGDEEVLLDDSVLFAAKAKEDGVAVQLDIFDNHFHVFNGFWKVLPKAREANKKLGEYIKAQLNRA